jgi:MmyB-like transcription regulator ligand binding domain
LAANELGRALFSELYAAPARPVNNARFVFLDPRAEAFYRDWDRAAADTVAILRWAAGHDPHDRELSDLVGELATQSEAFRTRWAQHNVRFHNTAVKQLHHPVVGDLDLSFNRLELPADHGLTIFTYTAEPGSRSEEAAAPRELGSHDRPRRVRPRDRPKLTPSATGRACGDVHVANAVRILMRCRACGFDSGLHQPVG